MNSYTVRNNVECAVFFGDFFLGEKWAKFLSLLTFNGFGFDDSQFDFEM